MCYTYLAMTISTFRAWSSAGAIADAQHTEGVFELQWGDKSHGTWS